MSAKNVFIPIINHHQSLVIPLRDLTQINLMPYGTFGIDSFFGALKPAYLVAVAVIKLDPDNRREPPITDILQIQLENLLLIAFDYLLVHKTDSPGAAVADIGDNLNTIADNRLDADLDFSIFVLQVLLAGLRCGLYHHHAPIRSAQIRVLGYLNPVKD